MRANGTGLLAGLDDMVAAIRGEIEEAIATKEAELADLRAKLDAFVGIGGATASRRERLKSRRSAKIPSVRSPKAPRRPKRSPDVDWDRVLKRLPERFDGVRFERATPSLKDYPQTRRVALARFVRSGLVVKTGDGKYRKAAS